MAENVPTLTIKGRWQIMVICRQLQRAKEGFLGVFSRH